MFSEPIRQFSIIASTHSLKAFFPLQYLALRVRTRYQLQTGVNLAGIHRE